MKRVVLVAIVLIITMLLGCSTNAPVSLPPTQETTPSVAPQVIQEPAPSPKVQETPTPPLPEPADFLVSGISVQPLKVGLREQVTITVSVNNTGGTEGTYTVVLTINGVKEADKSVTVAGGNTEDVTFTVTKEEAKSYSVVVDGLTASFVVANPIKIVTPTPKPSPKGPYNGPLFDSHLHTRNILQPQSAETLLSYLDREKVDWAICFNTFPSSKISSLMPVVRSIGSRVVMLRSGNNLLRGQVSEASLRQYLQPKGPLWGFGELGIWREEYQNVTFDSPHMQTIFQLANEVKGIVMIHLSSAPYGRPTELAEAEPSIRKYPDAIFLFHNMRTWDLVDQLMSKYPNVYFTLDFGSSFSQGRGVSLKDDDANAASYLAAVNQSGIDYIVERNLKDLAPLLQKYPDRIFWGTDFSESWHFKEEVTELVVRISRQFIGRLPADIQEKYAYQNAQRVFGRFLTPKQ